MGKGKNFGLYFDGRTQIEIGSAEQLKLTDTSFTVEVWVKVDQYVPTNTNRDTAILGINERNGAAGSILHLTIRNKRPYIGFFHIDTPGNQVIEEKMWYHLAFVYNKRNHQQLIYVNGKLDADSKTRFPGGPQEKTPHTGKGQIVLGNCMALNSFMLGHLKGLRIWDSALSEDRIRDSMNHEDSLTDVPGLTAYWTFENGLVNNFLAKGNSETKGSEVENLNIELDHLTSDNTELKLAIEKIKEEKEKLQKTIETQKYDISRLSEKVDREISDKSGVTIAALIKDANDQITEARNVLKGGDYNLGHVNLQFKMIPSERGDSVIFPSKDQIADSSGGLSTIDLEFAPKEASKVVEIPKNKVPDVKGLTEVMARRKIVQAGFMAELKYQAVKKREDKDRVVKQIPDPDKDPTAQVNSTILIFIGKEIL